MSILVMDIPTSTQFSIEDIAYFVVKDERFRIFVYFYIKILKRSSLVIKEKSYQSDSFVIDDKENLYQVIENQGVLINIQNNLLKDKKTAIKNYYDIFILSQA
jgi:hypothetical protein